MPEESPEERSRRAMYDSLRQRPVWDGGIPPLIQEPESGPSIKIIPPNYMPSPDQIDSVRAQLEKDAAALERMERGAEKFRRENPRDAGDFDKDLADLREKVRRSQEALDKVEKGA
jgi:hypothetical protein